jgi:hypothetical protein
MQLHSQLHVAMSRSTNVPRSHMCYVQCADSKQPDPQSEDVVDQIVRIALSELHQYPHLRRHFVRTSLSMYLHRQETAEQLYNLHLQVHTHGLSLPTLLLMIIYNTIIITYNMVIKEHIPVLAFLPTSGGQQPRLHCFGAKTTATRTAKSTC